MSLPCPSLDDRRFQDIVDEAKRLIPRYCPEWTDHNLSDPGIALIELFAWMTEMILYRLNQVPDLHYTKFLELMGIQLFGPAPAQAEIAFWLSAPQPQPVRVPAGTQVGTLRTEQEESVVFFTDEELIVVAPDLVSCLTAQAASPSQYEDHWKELKGLNSSVTVFSSLTPGDGLYLGFADSLEGNILRLDLKVAAVAGGTGTDPLRPPWAWEAWSGTDWVPVRVHSDRTGGMNQDGALVLFMPRAHKLLTLQGRQASWIRCRLLQAAPGQPNYHHSPELAILSGASLGGTMLAHHVEPVPGESLGRSDGSPGQCFRVRRSPVLPRRSPEETVLVKTAETAEAWTEVPDFSGSGADDRHFSWESSTGEICFGPRILYPDGRSVQHGAIPVFGAEVLVSGYRCGGGSRGNVGVGTVRFFKSSIPFIDKVENLDAGRNGVDAETVENAKLRGPMVLRAGQRAVTAADYERLALEASPLVARSLCVASSAPGLPVRVLILPRLDVSSETLSKEHLELPATLRAQVEAYLEERRMLTVSFIVERVQVQGVRVRAEVAAAPDTNPDVLRERLRRRLYRYLDPFVGDTDGKGWAFGRGLNRWEIAALLAGAPGVAELKWLELQRIHLAAGTASDAGEKIVLPPEFVFISSEHQVWAG